MNEVNSNDFHAKQKKCPQECTSELWKQKKPPAQQTPKAVNPNLTVDKKTVPLPGKSRGQHRNPPNLSYFNTVSYCLQEFTDTSEVIAHIITDVILAF